MTLVPAVRAGTWAALAIAGGLMCLSFPVFPNDLQAWGNNLAAAAVMAGGLVWHILHPPPDAGSMPCLRAPASYNLNHDKQPR